MSKNLRRHRQNGPGEPPAILEFTTDNDFEEEQKFETLFKVDGKSYELWVNPPASVGMLYLKMVREENQEVAVVWLLEQMIGKDGFEALTQIPDLKEKDVKQIMQIVKDYAMGDEEDSPTGN